MLRYLIIGALALPALLPQPAGAWGASGHSVIAEIAERRLPDTARRTLKTLIGEASLASLANWADSYAAIDPATRAWHSVNIPFGAATYDPARDCAGTPAPSCASIALQHAMAEFADRRLERAKRVKALQFLLHIAGDIHQPLHCTDRVDAGGSRFAVTFFGQPSNLHAVWDFGMLDRASYDWGFHVGKTQDWIAAQPHADSIADGTVANWLNECHAIGRSIYPDDGATALAEDYQAKYLPVVHQQLGRAALRLAAMLKAATCSGDRPGTTLPRSKCRIALERF